MSDIKVINELEFIGESLPKINFNFSDLDLRSQQLEEVKTQYMGLSSFYVKNNNTYINYEILTQNIQGNSGSVNKSNILATHSDPTNIVNKLIYPMPIYVKFQNKNASSTPTLRFKVKYKESSNLFELVNTKINRALDSSGSPTDYMYNLFTFIDDGFNSWEVSFDGGVDVEVDVKYLTKYTNI